MVRRMVRKGALHSSESRLRSQPTLEQLEPRLALANCVWTGAFGNGSWFNSFNWSNLTVPGSGDTAAFTQPAPNCTISGANATVGCLIIHGWGGTLTIGDGCTLSVNQTPTSGPSDIADGIITGNGSASLIFTNTTTVSLGGVINPSSTKFCGTTTLDGATTVSLGGAVSNSGTLTVQAGTILMQQSCVLTNYANFVMNCQGTTAAPTAGIVNGQLFMNAGSVYKTATGNTSFAVPFVNCSFLDIQKGTVTFTSSIIQRSGTLDVETGAILATTTNVELDGGSLFTGTSTISGDLNVVSASVHPGVLDAVPYGTLSISGMYLQGSASTLGMSILLNSNGTVKQYTKLNAASLSCAGGLAVATGPYRVTPLLTDVANIISSPFIAGDFSIKGTVPGTLPMLMWVHNLTNPPPNTYQLKIVKGGSTGTVGTKTASTSAAPAPAFSMTSRSSDASLGSTSGRAGNLLNAHAIDILMSKTRLRAFHDAESLLAWARARRGFHLENAILLLSL